MLRQSTGSSAIAESPFKAETPHSSLSVGEKMMDAHNKNRVTVYYLLAEHFGRLSDFS